jgi:hypothetical protein
VPELRTVRNEDPVINVLKHREKLPQWAKIVGFLLACATGGVAPTAIGPYLLDRAGIATKKDLVDLAAKVTKLEASQTSLEGKVIDGFARSEKTQAQQAKWITNLTIGQRTMMRTLPKAVQKAVTASE